MSICLDSHDYRQRCAHRSSRIVFGAAHLVQARTHGQVHGTRQIYRLISMYQSVTYRSRTLPPNTSNRGHGRVHPMAASMYISFPGSIRWLILMKQCIHGSGV